MQYFFFKFKSDISLKHNTAQHNRLPLGLILISNLHTSNKENNICCIIYYLYLSLTIIARVKI